MTMSDTIVTTDTTMHPPESVACGLHATQDYAYGIPTSATDDITLEQLRDQTDQTPAIDHPSGMPHAGSEDSSSQASSDGTSSSDEDAEASPNPTGLQSANRTTKDGAPYAWLHADFTYKGTPMTSTFVENGGAMNSVIFAGTVDLAVSGCMASSVVVLQSDTAEEKQEQQAGDDAKTEDAAASSTPSTPSHVIHVAIAMPDPVQEGVVTIDPSLMILALLNVGALCSSASNGETHAGFGFESLLNALKKKEALITLHYGQWKTVQHAVMLTNVHLRDGSDRGSKVVDYKVGKTLQAPPGVDELGAKQVAASFVNMVTEANQKRSKEMVYPLLPGLTKIFAAVPVTGYAPVEALLHAPSSIGANQLEHFLQAMVGIALQQDTEQVDKMRKETTNPPPLGTLSPWRHIAARALHLATRMSTDYREDGAVTLDGNNQPAMVALESFLPHAVRSIFDETNDCDGSTLIAMRMARQIGLSPFGDDRYRSSDGVFVSLDPGYDDAKHWATRGIRNALSHSHTLAFNIIGASSGEGAKVVDKKTGEAKLKVAGHAAAILLPLQTTLSAMDAGEYERTESDRASIDAARARVFFPEGKLRAIASPEQLETLLASPNAEIVASGISKLRREHLDGLRREGAIPFAIDGTITSEMDIHAPEEEAKGRAQQARNTLQAYARLGPVVADRVVDLTALGPKNTNAFYHDLVEAVIAGHIGDDPELVALGAAAHNFLYANVDAVRERKGDKIEIGAHTSNVHTGEMAMFPLVRLTPERVVMHNAIRQMVRLHSMPPRRPSATHRTHTEVANAQNSTNALHDLGKRLIKRAEDSNNQSDGTYLELYISPRTMWRNPHAVEHLVKRVDGVARRGQVDLIDLKEVQPNAVAAVISIEV